MTKTMTMSANQKGLSECRFQGKAVSIHCRFAPISTASLPSDGIPSSRRNPPTVYGDVNLWEVGRRFRVDEWLF